MTNKYIAICSVVSTIMIPTTLLLTWPVTCYLTTSQFSQGIIRCEGQNSKYM